MTNSFKFFFENVICSRGCFLLHACFTLNATCHLIRISYASLADCTTCSCFHICCILAARCVQMVWGHILEVERMRFIFLKKSLANNARIFTQSCFVGVVERICSVRMGAMFVDQIVHTQSSSIICDVLYYDSNKL